MDINAKLKESTACNQYGASMGRRDWIGDCVGRKFYLQKVKFYDGCYDAGGAYWGSPANLYCAWSDVVWDEEIQQDLDELRYFVRARSRDEAKAILRKECEGIRFYA